MNNPTLRALTVALNVKTTGPYTHEYLEVSVNKSNINKLYNIAKGLKHAGRHLFVEYKKYDGDHWFKIWEEGNTSEFVDSEMTMINIEYDLESCLTK